MSKKIYSPLELLYTPKKDNDAVSKKFVEDLLSKKIKENCLVSSDSNLTGFTYSSSDMTLTQDLGSEAPVILNNIEVPVHSRILVMGQTDKTQNGIYTLETQGVAEVKEGYELDPSGSLTVVTDGTLSDSQTQVELHTIQALDPMTTIVVGNTVKHIDAVPPVQAVLKRAEDFDESADVSEGCLINISTTNTQYKLISKEPIIIDTTNIEFVKATADDDNVKSYEGEIKVVDSQTDYELIHSLNTKNIVVSIVTEAYEPCYIDYVIDTENKITVKFDLTALPDAETKFHVVILARPSK